MNILCNSIAHSGIHKCAEGAFLPKHGQGSHAWVFSTSSSNTLWEGCGPTIGHKSLMTSYHAELSGLVSVLFTLHWLAHHQPQLTGTVTVYCENESALNKVFTKQRPSNNPYTNLAADRDLICLGRHLRSLLPDTLTIHHS